MYKLQGSYIDLFIMGRPWLSAEDFNIKMSTVTDTLDKQLENELSGKISLLDYNKKILKLYSYKYKFIIMDNYGTPILNKNNNLIGYKIYDGEYASIKTFYNDNNLLCNEVLILELDKINLNFKNEPIDSWVDIRTEFGFIREYNKKILLW